MRSGIEAEDCSLASLRQIFLTLPAAGAQRSVLGGKIADLFWLYGILLEPLIASLCQAYPEAEVEIAASEELVDLTAEGFDAGIRLSAL